MSFEWTIGREGVHRQGRILREPPDDASHPDILCTPCKQADIECVFIPGALSNLQLAPHRCVTCKTKRQKLECEVGKRFRRIRPDPATGRLINCWLEGKEVLQGYNPRGAASEGDPRARSVSAFPEVPGTGEMASQAGGSAHRALGAGNTQAATWQGSTPSILSDASTDVGAAKTGLATRGLASVPEEPDASTAGTGRRREISGSHEASPPAVATLPTFVDDTTGPTTIRTPQVARQIDQTAQPSDLGGEDEMGVPGNATGEEMEVGADEAAGLQDIDDNGVGPDQDLDIGRGGGNGTSEDGMVKSSGGSLPQNQKSHGHGHGNGPGIAVDPQGVVSTPPRKRHLPSVDWDSSHFGKRPRADDTDAATQPGDDHTSPSSPTVNRSAVENFILDMRDLIARHVGPLKTQNDLQKSRIDQYKKVCLCPNI